MKLPKTRSFVWKKDRLMLLDQRVLPHRTLWRTCRTWKDAADGIRRMVVRGAPAIGCTAAYGVVLAAQKGKLPEAFDGLLNARPTAVNLKWVIERMKKVWSNAMQTPSPLVGEGSKLSKTLVKILEREAQAIEQEDRLANAAMGRFGADLLPSDATLLTHCNTGSLATAGLGTAFGIIWTAHRDGNVKKVLASETRPYLQGARLTAWELKNEKIPFDLITDNMAAHLMKTEKIDAVIVGADRIAANGDTANKIGTYSLAVLAAYHEIPFYIAAPLSTLDLSTATGAGIPIEERSADEVTMVRGQRIAPENISVRHPSFDVTPGALITAIVTEKGVARAPYNKSLPALCRHCEVARRPATEAIYQKTVRLLDRRGSPDILRPSR